MLASILIEIQIEYIWIQIMQKNLGKRKLLTGYVFMPRGYAIR